MHPDPTPVKPKVGVDEQASAAEKADFEQLSVNFASSRPWPHDTLIFALHR